MERVRGRFPNIYFQIMNDHAKMTREKGEAFHGPGGGSYTPAAYSPVSPAPLDALASSINAPTYDGAVPPPASANPVAKPMPLSIGVTLLTKLIFLFAGGINNIAADDRRTGLVDVLEAMAPSVGPPAGLSPTARTDPNNNSTNASCAPPPRPLLHEDVALEAALHIPALGRLTMLAMSLGLEQDIAIIERVAQRAQAVQARMAVSAPRVTATVMARGERNLAKIAGLRAAVTRRLIGKAESCAECWKVLCQFVGILPLGDSCPGALRIGSTCSPSTPSTRWQKPTCYLCTASSATTRLLPQRARLL